MRESKCTQHRWAKLTWHYYTDSDGNRVVSAELRAMFDPALHPSVLKTRAAEFKVLVEDAALGRLDYSGDDLKEVARDPSLWELRWQTEDQAQWRMYHAEPTEVPSHLVSLRVHQKDVTGSDKDVRTKQDKHIDVASERFEEGKPRTWGI